MSDNRQKFVPGILTYHRSAELAILYVGILDVKVEYGIPYNIWYRIIVSRGHWDVQAVHVDDATIELLFENRYNGGATHGLISIFEPLKENR